MYRVHVHAHIQEVRSLRAYSLTTGLYNKKITQMYSLEYTGMSKISQRPHHVRHCCNNMIPGHFFVLVHCCTVTSGHCCAEMCSDNGMLNNCCEQRDRPTDWRVVSSVKNAKNTEEISSCRKLRMGESNATRTLFLETLTSSVSISYMKGPLWALQTVPGKHAKWFMIPKDLQRAKTVTN